VQTELKIYRLTGHQPYVSMEESSDFTSAKCIRNNAWLMVSPTVQTSLEIYYGSLFRCTIYSN